MHKIHVKSTQYTYMYIRLTEIVPQILICFPRLKLKMIDWNLPSYPQNMKMIDWNLSTYAYNILYSVKMIDWNLSTYTSVQVHVLKNLISWWLENDWLKLVLLSLFWYWGKTGSPDLELLMFTTHVLFASSNYMFICIFILPLSVPSTSLPMHPFFFYKTEYTCMDTSLEGIVSCTKVWPLWSLTDSKTLSTSISLAILLYHIT